MRASESRLAAPRHPRCATGRRAAQGHQSAGCPEAASQKLGRAGPPCPTRRARTPVPCSPSNKRLKLARASRVEFHLCANRVSTSDQPAVRRRALRPQLKRDPLGGSGATMPMTTRTCRYCKARRPDDLEPCPHCGAGARDSADDRFETHTPTIQISTNRPEEGVRGLVVAAPGATSTTSVSASGAVTIALSGSKGTGRYGEPRVKHVLYERVGRDHTFSRQEGAEDPDGEDDLIWIDGRRYVLQVVTALTSHLGLAIASTGTATTTASLDQVARWIEETIQGKAPSTNPPKTVLAIDANHLGAIAHESLIDAYHRTIGSAASFGFAAIWIVGPTVAQCLRLDEHGLAAT